MDALSLAILFHRNYERLAPSFGYATRDDTKQFDPSTPNGRLMVAVCAEILSMQASAEQNAQADLPVCYLCEQPMSWSEVAHQKCLL